MIHKRKYHFDELTIDLAEQFKLRQFQNVGSKIVGLMFPNGRESPSHDKALEKPDRQLKPQ